MWWVKISHGRMNIMQILYMRKHAERLTEEYNPLTAKNHESVN